ncbi:MAG: hypothetical protein H6817_03065 [Phycisphaerales bacterium]|nr:hypothetical protein [Phycisphaerales bacterium]
MSPLPPIPPRHAYTARHSSSVALYPIFGGAIYGMFAYLLVLDRFELGGLLGGLFLSGLIGMFAGLGSSPFVFALLRNRDFKKCFALMSWSVAALIIVTAILPLPPQSTIAFLIAGAPLLFLAVAILQTYTSPRLYFGTDICHLCGYDLRASVDAGRCPECGWQFGNVTAPQEEAEKGQGHTFGRLANRVWRHPLIALLGLTFILGLGVVYDRAQCAFLRRDLRSAIAKQQAAGSTFTPGQLTSFDWDELHVFGAYTSINAAEKALGFRWEKIGRTGIAMEEDIQVLAFVKDGHVVRYTVVRVWGDFAMPVYAESPITPNAKLHAVPMSGRDAFQVLPPTADTPVTNPPAR